MAETACAGCHGIDGVSTEPGRPHLAGQRAVYLYRTLNAYQTGTRTDAQMSHAIGFLNEDAIRSVAAYYASLPPVTAGSEASGEQHANVPLDEDPFADIRPAMKRCDKCHGETGNSSAGGMPSLTAQDPEYFLSSMLAYSNGGRDHRMMQRLVQNLDEEIIRKMGVYYAVQEPRRSDTGYQGDPEAGAALAEACASCHGADGNASAADMPSVAGQDARYFVKAMNAYADGERKHEGMFQAVDGLTTEEIQNLAAFYAVQEPLQRSIRKPFTSAEWIERCERCHGVDGNSSDPRFPMLAGQREDYLSAALQAYGNAERSSSTMHAMSAPLSASDIERIARYYSQQTPRGVIYLMLPCDEAE
ncbi:MAG: cytochrome c4 [Gammaproteobacteria bacterium]|nr:cytochrome c4 [Gammaproteobacteria bacterium]